MTLIQQTLGEFIKEFRKKGGKTQVEFAEELGISQSSLSKWETGSFDPSIDNLFRLSEVTGRPPEYLYRLIRPLVSREREISQA